jgi:hypothetical protein
MRVHFTQAADTDANHSADLNDPEDMYDSDDMEQLETHHSAPEDETLHAIQGCEVNQQLLKDRVVTHVSLPQVSQCKRFIDMQQIKAMARYERFKITNERDIADFATGSKKFPYSDVLQMMQALQNFKCNFMDGQRQAYSELEVRNLNVFCNCLNGIISRECSLGLMYM